MLDKISRSKKILLLIAVTFISNLAVAVFKITAGLITGLMSVTASGFESLLDASNNVIGFTAIHLSAKSPDSAHPYGHRKFETFVSLIIAFLMFLAGTQIFIAGIERYYGGSVPQVSRLAYVVVALSMLVSLLVSVTEWQFGRLYKSEFLLADSAHTLTDFFSSAIVILSIYLVKSGAVWADFSAALVVVIIILFIGARIIREAFTTLVDTSRIEPNLLEFACLQVDGVKAVHKIRSRGTPDAIKVDLHIKVSRDLPIEDAHSLSHRVKDKLLADFPQVDDVIVHVEPWYGR